MFAPVIIVIVIASPQHKDMLCHAAIVYSTLHNGTSGNINLAQYFASLIISY